MSKKFDVAQTITDQIIDMLKSGATLPWNKPWKPVAGSIPANMVTGHIYSGGNTFWLSFIKDFKGYSTNWWLTFKQAKELGGKVKKGEKATMVTFWKISFKSEEGNYFKSMKDLEKAGETFDRKTFYLNYYNVFNADQVEDIEIPEVETPKDFGTIEKLEEIEENWKDKPRLDYGGNRACYSSVLDRIKLPEKHTFESKERFYSIKWHEYGHSTGHRERLNRKLDNEFGSKDYAREELVAEMFAAFMCGIGGIEKDNVEQNAAYIQNWLKALENDKNLIIVAGKRAQNALDYVLSGGKGEKAKGKRKSKGEVAQAV